MPKNVELTLNDVLGMYIVLASPEVSDKLEALTVGEKLRTRKLFRAVAEGYEVYNKKRIELVDQYAPVDEQGNKIVDDEGRSNIPKESEFWAKLDVVLNESCPVAFVAIPYGKLRELVLPFSFVNAFEKVLLE